MLSPDHLHEEHAITILEAGISVFLEKPMAITVEGCDRILAAAKAARASCTSATTCATCPSCARCGLIDQGLIGEVKAVWCRHFVGYGGDCYFKDWHADRAKSTGLLLQKGAHDIDVLH